MSIAPPDGSSTPGTFVELGPEPGTEIVPYGLNGPRPQQGELAPELALVLAAVLLAAAEQVSAEKLRLFAVPSRELLPIHALAMAFRDDDTGLVGDVFEWALLLAVNAGDPAVNSLIADALTLARVPFEQPQAVLVAAEPGRLVAYSPELPMYATLATGRRGRPPHVANLLREATTRDWKADLLLGSGDRWVGASLKSNPIALTRSLRAAAETPHPPRIGITASSKPAVVRDPGTGVILVHVPVNSQTMALAKIVLADVRDAFSRHLSVPDSPLRQDVTGIGLQLARWRDRTVDYAVSVLLDYAGEPRSVAISEVASTGASVPDAHDALVVVDTILGEDGWRYTPNLPIPQSVSRRQYSQFDPID